MELCVMIEGQEGVTWPQWLALARACEEHGVPALFRSDHYLPLDGFHERPVLDAWGTVCALAAATTTLRLGTMVSPATFRHPSVLAKLAATADHVSGGRVEVGLGAGWHAGEHEAFGFDFGDLAGRMEIFAEQLEVVRGLWGDEPVHFEGRHYRLAGVDARPKPVQRPGPPLIVGGQAKRRTTTLAARFADEYNTVFPTPEEARERRTRTEAAWRDAGRDPATLRFSVMTGCVVGRDEAEFGERLRAVGAKRGEPDFALARGWVGGTVEDTAEQLQALAAAGVDRVMLQLLVHEDLDQVAVVGRELAPRVAA